MALHIKLNNVKFDDMGVSSPRVHLLPCTIKANGDANVSKYFEPIIEKKEEGYLAASFRGYPLLGREVKIPEGYHGYTMYETKENISEESDRTLFVSEVFKTFKYWNYDKVPTVNDGISNSFKWISLAEASVKSFETVAAYCRLGHGREQHDAYLNNLRSCWGVITVTDTNLIEAYNCGLYIHPFLQVKKLRCYLPATTEISC